VRHVGHLPRIIILYMFRALMAHHQERGLKYRHYGIIYPFTEYVIWRVINVSIHWN